MTDREKFEAWWMSDVPEEHHVFAKKLLDGYGPDYRAAAGVAGAWAAWRTGRRAALEEAAEAIDTMNDSAGDRASYDNREMYNGELDRMHALSEAAARVRALANEDAARTGEPT